VEGIGKKITVKCQPQEKTQDAIQKITKTNKQKGAVEYDSRGRASV
jgi:hypothetical protein